MNRPLILACLTATASLCGCVIYPKAYWKTFKGKAVLEDGKPIVIKAQLLKHCENLQGESEKMIRERQTTTDAQGNYKLSIEGMAWNVKNFSSDSGCQSRIQLFVCRDVCKPVDEIDITVLGK
jgi:hypothetical protein